MTAGSFAEKYAATPFDPDDPGDARAEAARQAVTDAFLRAMKSTHARTGDDMSALTSGMLVGLVGVLAAQVEPSDRAHAAIRSGLLTTVPWAVDMMRTFYGLPPLPEV